jgi:hypothetical protein
LTIDFSGKQQENTDILTQYVPLVPRRRYVLAVRYRVSDIGAESGLMCAVNVGKGQDLLKGQGLLPGGETGDLERKFEFETPEKTTMGRLIFGYHRILGTMRIEGSVTLRKFSLTLPGEGSR